MTPAPKTRVRRATVHIPASDVMPVTVRGYGFQAECDDCGRIGKVQSYSLAYQSKRAHEVWHSAQPRVSLAGPV